MIRFAPWSLGNAPFAAPATYPITLATAKAQCRVPDDITDDDTALTGYIATATEYAENYTGRRFVTQTWDVSLDCFKSWIFDIPFGPVQSITSITYTDIAGNLQTLATTVYGVDIKSFVPRLYLKLGQIWPITQPQLPNPITIRMVVGYGIQTDVPSGIATAIAAMVAFLFDNRGEMTAKQGEFINGLLAQHKASWV